VGVGGHEAPDAMGDGDADREIDEEDRAPVQPLGEGPAEQDADRGARTADGTPDPERLGALGPVKAAGDDGQRGGRQHRGADPLRRARSEEHRLTARERRRDGRCGEDPEACEEHPPASQQVRGAAAEKQQAAKHERVAGDRPPQLTTAESEVAREVGECDVHRGDVEDDHELSEREQQQERRAGSLAG
jgi:hypothetical protein